MKTYIILQLILNAATGQPIEVHQYDAPTVYLSITECEQVKADLGPQKPADGKISVYTCATEKQITQL